MKKASLALIMGATLVLSACGSEKTAEEAAANDTKVTYTTETEQHSYALGARMGKFAKDQVVRQDELGIESDQGALVAGFNDAFNGQSQFSDEEVEAYVQAFSTKFQTAEQADQLASAAVNIEAGISYLVENGKREEVITTESGLQYEVLTVGDGANPTAEDTVRVHYHGTLIDGTVFDSSVDRGQPAEFPLNRVITGWTEGLQLMKVGSKYRLYIPSELAYGQRATGNITPNSTLVFDVELLAIAPFTD
ncbi:MAG: FKBP-type peptidyl-prolyl cis-trans isomerase FkpA [Alphaproteobacteria bacterium]|jgi:FKBP-type peptidyl-prolyl cis-trans isomerase FkpA